MEEDYKFIFIDMGWDDEGRAVNVKTRKSGNRIEDLGSYVSSFHFGLIDMGFSLDEINEALKKRTF